MKVRNIFKIGALSFNILAVIALVFSVFATYLSPEKYHFSAYLGMAFLPLVFINICFFIFWTIHLKWHALFSFSILLLFTPYLQVSFSPINTTKKMDAKVKQFNVLTYNVQLFNYYSKKNIFFDYINNSGADVVCLQEYGWHKNEDKYLSKKDIITALRKIYPYYHENIRERKNSTFGIATFSKYPIVKKENIDYESIFNSSMYSDIKIGDDTIRLFNNHLESNKLTKEDKEKLADSLDSETISYTAGKLGKAAAIRAKQAEIIAGEIQKSPYKVLVCGDFNDTPISYVYQTIQNDLSDTFVGSGNGLGITFSEKLYRFRLDYILTDKNLHYSDYNINKIKHSDHYPVSCKIGIPN